jgi:hypothetical protein
LQLWWRWGRLGRAAEVQIRKRAAEALILALWLSGNSLNYSIPPDPPSLFSQIRGGVMCEFHTGEERMADVVQINCALWGMMGCAVLRLVELAF